MCPRKSSRPCTGFPAKRTIWGTNSAAHTGAPLPSLPPPHATLRRGLHAVQCRRARAPLTLELKTPAPSGPLPWEPFRMLGYECASGKGVHVLSGLKEGAKLWSQPARKPLPPGIGIGTTGGKHFLWVHNHKTFCLQMWSSRAPASGQV